VTSITAKGGDAIVADAATDVGAMSIVEAGVSHFGLVDTLVNNAGDGGPTKPVQEYATDEWFYTVNSCLTSAYMCTRFAVPHMIAAGGGSIVNISSMAGRRGLAYRVGYCSAKAGQIGMTYGLALELGQHNITVNAIAPGAVEGDRIDRMVKEQAVVRGITVDAMRQRFLDHSPLRRMSTAGDIAALARVSVQRAGAEHLRPVYKGHGRRTGVTRPPRGARRLSRAPPDRLGTSS
jgi:NAD(P)-dependent dehydrogenase (short-subunit alcohol dehydrogenase family)